jgi:uncharacterized membrane protein
MRKLKIKRLALTAIFIALTFVATFTIRIPTPTKGYINAGDCIILISSWMLGPLWSAAVGGIGSALADVVAGYAIYAPATLIIKALTGAVASLIFHKCGKKIYGMIIGGAVSEIIMIAGYFLFESILYGVPVSLTGIPGNAVQGITCLVTAVILYRLLLKTPVARKAIDDLENRDKRQL